MIADLKIYFLLGVWLLAGCVAESGFPNAYDHQLDVKQNFSSIEQFLGQRFDGESVSDKERNLEKFFHGWPKERLLALLRERQKTEKFSPRLETRGEAVLLIFEFVAERNSMFDVQVVSIVFTFKNGDIVSTWVHNSFSYGLSSPTAK